MTDTGNLNTQEYLKGQITAVQNVLSMLIAAHPNAEQLKAVIRAVSQQVAPTLNDAHPEFKKGWLGVIATVSQSDEEEDAGSNGQH